MTFDSDNETATETYKNIVQPSIDRYLVRSGFERRGRGRWQYGNPATDIAFLVTLQRSQRRDRGIRFTINWYVAGKPWGTPGAATIDPASAVVTGRIGFSHDEPWDVWWTIGTDGTVTAETRSELPLEDGMAHLDVLLTRLIDWLLSIASPGDLRKRIHQLNESQEAIVVVEPTIWATRPPLHDG